MKNKRKLILAAVSVVFILAAILCIVFLTGGNDNVVKQNGPADEQSQASPTPVVIETPIPTENSDNSQQEENVPKDGQNNQTGQENVVKKDVKVKAVYLSANSAAVPSRIDQIINLAKNTELNAVVIDIKERFGKIYYDTDVELAKENGLVEPLYDPKEVIKKLHDAGVYVIGRIVCFNDDGLGAKRPDLAILKTDGKQWRDENSAKGYIWVNPYKQEVIDYNIQLAIDAVEHGFDEIQFDYVRFPSGTGKYVDYGSDVPEKSEAISGFLKKAYHELHEVRGVKVSADVFGYILISTTTKDTIGQDLEQLVENIDIINPMVYPSHYSNASKKVMGNGVGQKINGILYTKPDTDPYGVVYNSLLEAKKRIENTNGKGPDVVVRPYLQAFTAKYLENGYYIPYGAKEIRQQIQAVYDAGYEEWILWNSENKYPEGAFLSNP